MSDTKSSTQNQSSLIAGRYIPVKHYEGGMGIVVFCLDTFEDDFPIALKTFKPEYLADRESRDRFLREATIWIDLGFHPHIVQAYRVEYVQKEKTVFLVLQLIPSAPGKSDPSLRSWVYLGVPLEIEMALKISIGVARGMIHATQIFPTLIHRDLKPENILLGPDGIARITDFGLASVVNFIDVAKSTRLLIPRNRLTQGAIGTPIYMSPEQWREDNLDSRTDIYAFGCILFEMLTGQQSVVGYDTDEIIRAHINGIPLTRLSSFELPENLKAFLQLCLQPDLHQRISTWTEVEQCLIDLYKIHIGKDPDIIQTPHDVSKFSKLQKAGSYLAIGSSYVDIGKPKVGIDYFTQALEMSKTEDYPLLTASASTHLGVAHYELGDYMVAIEYYDRAIELYSKYGSINVVAYNLGNKGNAYFGLHNLVKAERYLSSALEVSESTEDSYGKSLWLANLGNVYSAKGEFKVARNYYEEALKISNELGDPIGECSNLANLANVLNRSGNYSEAIELLIAALDISHNIGNFQVEGTLFITLGNIYISSGQIDPALESFTQSLRIAEETGNNSLKSRALGNLGAANITRGDLETASSQLKETIHLSENLGLEEISARANWSLGLMYEIYGSYNKSIEHLRRAVLMYKRLGMPEYPAASEHLKSLRKRLGLL